MHNISVCVLVANYHPEIFGYGYGTSATSAVTATGDSVAPDIEAATTNIDINKGFN